MRPTPEMASWKGQLFEERSDIPLEGRVRDYAELVKQNPADPTAWWKYGVLLQYDQSLNREALEAISRALSYDPLNFTYICDKGWVLLRLNRFEEAASQYALASTIKLYSDEPWYYLGMCHFYLRDYDAAIACYNAIYTLPEKPIDMAATLHWHWLSLCLQGKQDDAAALLRRIHTTDQPQPFVNPFGDVSYAPIYHKACLMYKGWVTPDALLLDARHAGEDVDYNLMAFIAVYLDMTGQKDKARALYEEIYTADKGRSVMTRLVGETRLAVLGGDAEAFVTTGQVLGG